MYDTAGPLHLDYINQQHLPRRYESEEEDISEPEMGGHDHAFSPVESYQSSNTEINPTEIERPGLPRLLSAYSSSGKTSRPVSMDTIKRSSGTTFAADSYIFDNDDDVIIELPSPDGTSPLQSPIFLAPNVYVASESPMSTRPQSLASLSSASAYSEDESDLLVAEQVKIVEPTAKPNLILISPVSEHSPFPFKESVATPNTIKKDTSDNDSPRMYSHQSAATSQPLLNKWNQDSTQDEGRKWCPGNMRLTTRDLEPPPTGLGATNLSPLEVPELAHPMSLRTHSMTFPRPGTAVSERVASSELQSRRPTDPPRRPPSLRSMSSASLPFFPGRQPQTDLSTDARTRSMSYTHLSAKSVQGLPSQSSYPSSRPASPPPYYSSPSFTRERTNSSHSATSFNRAPPFRQQLKKASTSSSIYSSSLRSEVASIHSLDPGEVAEPDFQRKVKRKKSLRRVRQSTLEPSESSSKKSFMEFMFRSKRKSTIKSVYA
ncbi:hypothetical protein BDV28DRAFT_90053 [Aspergillus coremiiformis]|uniref:Uncharacterized protein n=1 Tax=Aspergillus coremiiformis TaxID=138285 RepID=A0A5N6ZDQ8_9EURO|nr:hypothetical protein BDV28DRAFT_90053 [Aspergillus coremiiformis]